jgi:glutaredoxin 3
MIEIFGKPSCPFCDKAKALCVREGYTYEYKSLGQHFTTEELFERFPNARTFPQIAIDGQGIGGYTELESWHNNKIGAADI